VIRGSRFVLVLLIIACTAAPKPAAQNPSPMAESVRAHERLAQTAIEGTRFTIDGVLAKPVDVLVTPRAAAADGSDLIIHFHGASWLPMQAALSTDRPLVVASVNLGAGGGVYEAAFADPATFRTLLEKFDRHFAHIYLSGFSAGYGAIRAILRQQPDSIDGILLLDGLHTGYIPDRKPIAEGGTLDVEKLEPFRLYARRAAAGEKRFVFTHSEIFPGTFASTTETAEYLIHDLGLTPMPVLRWGPLGMQQISEARRGGFVVLGFAGNSAPDHVDHFHALPQFLRLLW
jgi:hypothetical protein